MKRTAFIFWILLILIMSCQTKTKEENLRLKERVLALEQENEAYKRKEVKFSTSIKENQNFLKEINDNLKEIDISSSMIGELDAEINKDADIESQIKTRLKTVEELIRNSKMKILTMDNQLYLLRRKSQDNSEDILNLESELSQAILNLMEKEKEFNALSSQLDNQLSVTQELKTILDRAYFYSGTSKEMKKNGIIENEGGFIGLGRVKMLNANAPDSLFRKIEKSLTDSIIVKSKDIQIISNHPSDSYEIKKNNYRHALIIKNREAFWSKGNYLVIQMN